MKYKEMLAFVTYLNAMNDGTLPTWNEALGKLNRLMDALEPYEDPAEEGNYPSIDAEDYRRIEKVFDEAVKSTQDFLKEPADDQTDNNIRRQLTKNLNKEFLSKAYVEFKNVKPNPGKSLHESMENFRYQNVELSNEDLRNVGANLSSRIQLTVNIDGTDLKGVFTKSTTFNPDQRYENLLSDMKLKYGKFGSFFDSLNDENFYARGLASLGSRSWCDPTTGHLRNPSPEEQQNILDGVSDDIRLYDYPEIQAEFEKYRNDPDFFLAMGDFALQADKFNAYFNIYDTTIKLQSGQNIDNRNSAMSSVANLLGQGDLLAKSKQLTVKMPDGSFQTGTFMEFVEGKDINDLDAIDEMRILGLEAYETPEVKAKLANLQVIDYICGNVDRHGGNLLYQFDPQTKKLIGVKGIDNDAAFLKRSLEFGTGSNQLASLKEMGVIDKTMADKLLTIDEGALSATLHGYGLSDAEINASWERLKNIQDAIKISKEFDPEKGFQPPEGNSFVIVKTEDWDKLDIKTLKQFGRRNIFKKMENIQHSATGKASVNPEVAVEAENGKRSLKAMLSQDNTKDLLKRAKSDKPFMRTSSRYLKVLSALEDYQNEENPKDPLSNTDHPNKWVKLKALKDAVENYKQEKIALGHLDKKGTMLRSFKGKDLRRIQNVEDIGKFADRLFQQRDQAIIGQANLAAEEAKVRQANEFKAKSPQQQQDMLQAKYQEEALKKVDLSKRLEQDLEEEDNVLDQSFESEQNLSMDDASISID